MARLTLAVMKSESVVRTEVVLQGDAVEVARHCDGFQVAGNEADAALRSADAQSENGGRLWF